LPKRKITTDSPDRAIKKQKKYGAWENENDPEDKNDNDDGRDDIRERRYVFFSSERLEYSGRFREHSDKRQSDDYNE